MPFLLLRFSSVPFKNSVSDLIQTFSPHPHRLNLWLAVVGSTRPQSPCTAFLTYPPGLAMGKKETGKVLANAPAQGKLPLFWRAFFLWASISCCWWVGCLLLDVIASLFNTNWLWFQEWDKYSNNDSFLGVIFWILDVFWGFLHDYSFYKFCFTGLISIICLHFLSF